MCKDTLLSILEKKEFYISRCLQLAKMGIFEALPNPSVGAVLVYNDRIIGEGATSKYGGPHAEVNAINAVSDPELLKEATLYVSLEPCSHFGKTPPCADLIIEKKIPKVVIGIQDPFAKVCGQGIKKLKAAGVEVIVGVLEKECEEVNQRFFTFHEKKRPYIILKWAQTQDGYIAPLKKDFTAPFWISNPYSLQLVHKWRSEEISFLVGTQTVLDDNPTLNTRKWYGKNPTRIYIDRKGIVPDDFHLKDQSQPTICITENKNLKSLNNLTYICVDFSKHIIPQICSILYDLNILSLVIEGGRQTIQEFIDLNMWDEARIFTANKYLYQGTSAPKIKTPVTKETATIESDTLDYIYPLKR